MPQIRPITDLRNTSEISDLCHARREPVFITKNGYGDLVVMSIETYERLAGKFELYALLEKGMEDIRQGRTVPARTALSEIRKDLENGTL